MNFIQEVLSLLERKQDKKKLHLQRDYFEFGRKKSSSIGNPLYSPKMTPHAIKFQYFKCEVIVGLVSGTGTENTLPVFSTIDPANCNVQTMVDSVYSQDANATTGTVAANLTVNGDLLVLGKQTIIESTIVEIADNIIELNTQGADVDAGFSVGTVNGLKTFGWDAGALLWNTFKESLMTKDIIVNRAIKQDGETLVNVVNEAEGLASQDNDESLATVAAIIDWSDQMDLDVAADAGTPLDILLNSMVLQIRGGDNINTFADGTEKIIVNLNEEIKVKSVISDYLTLTGAPGDWTVTSIVNDFSSIVDYNDTLLTAKAIVTLIDSERDYINDVQLNGTSLDFTGVNNAFTGSVDLSSLSGGGGSVPVMTSTVTGTGKLWDDTVQVEDALPVSAEALRTYGVQFNDASQLVVNVPWVEGSGGSIVIGNPGSPTEDLTSISIDGTVYGISTGGGGSVTSVGLAAPSAFTVTDSPVTGVGTLTLAGAGATTDYIDGTGALQAFPSIPTLPANIVETVDTQNGTYIDMTPTGAVDGDVIVTAELSAIDGVDTSGKFLSKDNVWSAIPGGNPGTVTSVGLSTDIAAFQVGSSPITDNGTIELNLNGGTVGQFLRQDGTWATIPTGGSMSSWTVKDGTGIGPVLDGKEVQFIGDDKITTLLTDNGGDYILSIDHDNTERIDTGTVLSPAFGDTFKVVDSITQDDQGHPTAVNLVDITLPTPSVGATEAFKTIKVDNAPNSNIPAQADVIADAAADTLAYKGGRQISITTDPTNDVITWNYLRTLIIGGGLIEDADGGLGMEEITIGESTKTVKLANGASFDVEDVTYNNKGQATARETTTYELEIASGAGTTNCGFGLTFDNKLIAINGGLPGIPDAIKPAAGTGFGFKNTSGERRNYAITYTLEFNGQAGANFYRFETGLSATDTPNNTKVQLVQFEDQIYANAESNFSKTYTYYAANLADQESIVATINEISAALPCPKAFIVAGSMTVISSSCDATTEENMSIASVDRE